MKEFRRGTPVFGVLTGIVFLLTGALVMWLGFWKTLVLVLLFAIGYFVGAVDNKRELMKGAVDKVVPGGKEETIDFREEIRKEQETQTAYRPDEQTKGLE